MAPIAQSTLQPEAVVHDPLAGANFTLDSSGVAGFFGGDTAVHGMATVNLFRWRKWGGWYNTPGSYEIAKQYGQLANARICKGLFPGGTDDPSQLFGLNGKVGPKFLATRSGSLFEQTGHLAALIVRMARRTKPDPVKKGAMGRITIPATVTVIDLPEVPEEIVYPKLSHHHSALFAVVPIGASVGACIGCGLVADWWSFSSILLGMFANGCACFVLGSGRLTFKHHKPARGAPRGDGIFISNNAGVVVIRGEEGAVNCLTRGRFYLEYEKSPTSASTAQQSNDGQVNVAPSVEQMPAPAKDDSIDDDPEKQADGDAEGGEQEKEGEDKEDKDDRDTESAPSGGQPNSFGIGLCSILLTAQFLVQLLLIPQGILFGQVMFVSTLAVSWGYNSYLSSINREDIQTEILCNILDPNKTGNVRIRKLEFGTWTAMSTFACLALQGHPNDPLPDHSSMVWNALLPNTTEVWTKWRTVVNERLRLSEAWTVQQTDYKVGVGSAGEAKPFIDQDQKLLRELLGDAQIAHSRYLDAYGVHQRKESNRA